MQHRGPSLSGPAAEPHLTPHAQLRACVCMCTCTCMCMCMCLCLCLRMCLCLCLCLCRCLCLRGIACACVCIRVSTRCVLLSVCASPGALSVGCPVRCWMWAWALSTPNVGAARLIDPHAFGSGAVDSLMFRPGPVTVNNPASYACSWAT